MSVHYSKLNLLIMYMYVQPVGVGEGSHARTFGRCVLPVGKQPNGDDSLPLRIRANCEGAAFPIGAGVC